MYALLRWFLYPFMFSLLFALAVIGVLGVIAVIYAAT